jgi:hypothetical protein
VIAPKTIEAKAAAIKSSQPCAEIGDDVPAGAACDQEPCSACENRPGWRAVAGGGGAAIRNSGRFIAGTSGRCHRRRRGDQFALLFAHERFERLGLRAADLFDRIRHRKTPGFRGEARGAESLPERG